MKKIELLLDDHLVSGSDREDLKEIIKKSGIKSSISECDTHAMGGISWFPTDLIITIFDYTAMGFFGALGLTLYKQLKNKIKDIVFKNKVEAVYISFDLLKVRIYFEINRFMRKDEFDIAFNKIESDFEFIANEINRLIDYNPEGITGKFNSITFIFDVQEKKWIISHFNIYK